MRWVFAALTLASVVWAQPPVGSRPFRIEELHAPPGFEVSVYATVPGGPRFMAFGPDGALYVAAMNSGTIVAVSKAKTTTVVVRGLDWPHSVVFAGGDLYIGDHSGVMRVRNGAAERIIPLPGGGGHVSRTVTIGPDNRLYLSAGSSCNFCTETEPWRAAITRYELDGTGQTRFAFGLRNSVGLAWHPATGELWATENGGDGLGDDVPPEELNIIRQNGDYGWPDCMADRRPVNWGAGARPSRCADTIAPEVQMQAHSAPLGIAFYTADGFPAAYRNDAFVAFHGSWNRNEPTGYKVVRVHGGQVEDFLTGFLDLPSRTTSGRPVHAIPGPDGALYISDDMTGNIYRVAYNGPRIFTGGVVDRGSGIYELYGSGLERTSVMVGNTPAQILYASPGQINFAVPAGVTGDLTVTVHNGLGADSAPIPHSSL